MLSRIDDKTSRGEQMMDAEARIAGMTRRVASRRGLVTGTAVTAAALAATAAWVARRARQAEYRDPPKGTFISVDDVRLHYIERGEGPAVVLLHGNVVRLEDFMASG